MKETIFLPPAVKINMDNYKPYGNIHELRDKAKEYLMSLKGVEFSLEESNPSVKFYISTYSIKHTIREAGRHKLIITAQLPEIFKQAIVFGVEDEQKGDRSVDHVLRCGSYIMMEGKLYVFYFILKLKKGGVNYLYDGFIDISLPEENKSA